MIESECPIEDWNSLQELKLVGDSSTIAIKKSSWTADDVDRFNIDHYVAHNEELDQSQIKITLASTYQEHADVETAQLGAQGEGPLKELRKALGELALLQTLTSALHENNYFELKVGHGQEFDKSSLQIPLTQEIDLMQKINSSAHQSLLARTSTMKENITKRRNFEADLINCREHWSILCCDRRTRKVSDRPEVVVFQQDRDILAIDCFWRKRPLLYQNPFYCAFLQMNESTGNAELDPLFNQHILENSKSAFFTLQVSLESISQQQKLASLDLWTLLHDSKEETVASSNYSEHLRSIFQRCEALKHTSFARELFGNVVEEVNKVTSIVTAVRSSTSGASFVENDVALANLNPDFALSEQFSLCQHSDRDLQWQVAADVKLSIRLVPLTLERVSLHTPGDSMNRCMAKGDDKSSRHWQRLVSTVFVTLIGTFHTVLLTAQRKEEIERNWRHRSGETERQVISRRNNDVPPLTDTENKERVIQPQSMLADAFHVLRVQHQKLRVLACLQDEVYPILATSGLVNRNNKDSFSISSVSMNDMTHKALAMEVHDWSDWWQQKIAPLFCHEHSLVIDVDIPSSFYHQDNKSNQIVSQVTMNVVSSSKAEKSAISRSMLEKDLLVVDVVHRASVPSPSRDKPFVTRDVVTTPNLATVVVQHVLSYSLSWLSHNYWTPLLSTSYSWSIGPTVRRTELVLVDSRHPETAANLAYCNMSLCQAGDGARFVALTWQIAEALPVPAHELLSQLMSSQNGRSDAGNSEMFQQSTIQLGQYAHVLADEPRFLEMTFLWKN